MVFFGGGGWATYYFGHFPKNCMNFFQKNWNLAPLSTHQFNILCPSVIRLPNSNLIRIDKICVGLCVLAFFIFGDDHLLYKKTIGLCNILFGLNKLFDYLVRNKTMQLQHLVSSHENLYIYLHKFSSCV